MYVILQTLLYSPQKMNLSCILSMCSRLINVYLLIIVVASINYVKKSQICEIKCHNYLVLFFIQWRKRASVK